MRPVESFVGQPIRSLQTMLRVIAQNDAAHPDVIPDGIYGPETVAAVSAFQKLHALPITGITDQNTWEAIVEVYNPSYVNIIAAHPLEIVLAPGQIIRKGERHCHLYLVQGMLTTLAEIYHSVSQPTLSGLLDEATAEAIASFQVLSGLPMTGQLDKHTWKHLVLQYPLAAGLQSVPD